MPIMPESTHPPVHDIDIKVPVVHALLSKINPQKLLIHDDIPTYVLKETAHVITPMLAHLLEQSLESGEIPWG